MCNFFFLIDELVRYFYDEIMRQTRCGFLYRAEEQKYREVEVVVGWWLVVGANIIESDAFIFAEVSRRSVTVFFWQFSFFEIRKKRLQSFFFSDFQ